jgi:hypothetical protein
MGKPLAKVCFVTVCQAFVNVNDSTFRWAKMLIHKQAQATTRQ